jgi:hypothetical protein
VRADGLDFAVVGLAEGARGLEVLLASPALRQDGQRQVDLDVGHCVAVSLLVVGTGLNSFCQSTALAPS